MNKNNVTFQHAPNNDSRHPALKGVRGWLLFFVVTMIVYGLSWGGAIAYMQYELQRQAPNLAATTVIQRYFLFLNMIAWTTASTCWGIALLLITSRLRHTIRFVLAGLWISGPAAFAALTHLPYMLNPAAIYSAMDAWPLIIGSVFWSGLWTAYLLNSRRVKNTYG